MRPAVNADRLVRAVGMEIVPFTAIEIAAAQDGFVRYGKGRHPAGLNFGDCFAYGLAATRGVPLLFKGRDYALTDLTPAL